MTGARRQSRHTTTIVLVALAGAAATWLLFAERSRVTSQEREVRRGRLFSAWRGDEVARLSVVSSHGSFTVRRDRVEDRDSRSFTVESGEIRAPADPQSVDRILESLDLATYRREVAKGAVDRGAMGLDAPRVRAEVAMGDLVVRIAIGNPVVPASDGAYAEIDGERVVVVAPALVEVLDVGAEAVRDKKLVPYTSPELTTIVLAGDGDRDGGPRRFVRASWPASRGTAFRVEATGPRVDARAFRGVVEVLGSLEAELLVDGEPSPADAKVVVTLTPKSGPDALIALGAPCPGHADLVLAARRAPTKLAGCIKPDAVAAFLRPRGAFEDRHLVGTSLDELIEVKVESNGEVLEMARRGTGFFVRRPEERNVPEVAARGFLDALVQATGDLEAVEPKDLDGPTSATLRVISRPVAEGDPERIEVLRIGPSHEGKRAVRRDEDGAGLWVKDEAVRPLLVGSLVLRDRKIVDVAAEKVREVAVVAGDVAQRVRRAGSAVELVEPRGPGLVADEQWGLELLDRAAQLEAMRWIASVDDGAFGLVPPRATLEIRIEDELGKPETERTVKILLGARGDDGTFAQVAGKPEVFFLPLELETAAMRPLVDRGALAIRIADVKKVSLRAGSAPALELEKREGVLVPTGSSEPAARTRASSIRDGLEDLVAMTAVTVGEAKKEEGFDAPVLTVDVTPLAGRAYRLSIGAADVRDGVSIHHARRSDVGATFAVPTSGVRTLLEALR